MLGELLNAVIDRLKRAGDERVAAHPNRRTAVEFSPHRLELSARNAFDADDPDRGIPLDKVGQLVDLVLFPLRDRLGLADGLALAHASTSTAGPIVVFT